MTTTPDDPPRWAGLAERIAGNIRAELGRQRRTRQSLAARTGIRYRTLDRRLLDAGDFRVAELVLIADDLDMSVADLIGPPRPRPTDAIT